MIQERIEKIYGIAFGINLKKENLHCFTEAVISLDQLEVRVSDSERKIIERMILRLYELLEIRCEKIRERENDKKGNEMDIMLDGHVFRGKIYNIQKVMDGAFIHFEDMNGKKRGHIFFNAGDLRIFNYHFLPMKKSKGRYVKAEEKKDLETVEV